MNSFLNKGRIEQGSALFSNEVKKLQFDEVTSDEQVTKYDEERFKELEETFEEKLKEVERKSQEKIKEVEQREYTLKKQLKEKEEKLVVEHETKIIELKKQMWDEAVNIAKEIIFKEIEKQDLDISSLFENTLKTLPVSFSKLTVSLNPETLSKIEEGAENKVFFSHIEWRLDYKMANGDFVIETEEEFFDCRLETLLKDAYEAGGLD